MAIKTNSNNPQVIKWKNIAAYVYLTICVFDFVIMPMLTFFFHAPPASLISLIGSISPSVQPDLIKDFYGPWQPLTENDGGLFHIIFMTLLGVISWSQDKIDIEKTQKNISTPDSLSNVDTKKL